MNEPLVIMELGDKMMQAGNWKTVGEQKKSTQAYDWFSQLDDRKMKQTRIELPWC